MITMSPCTTLAPRRPLGTSQLWRGHWTGHLAWCCPMVPPANLPQYTSAGIHRQHFQLHYYQRNHRLYHVGLLQIDTFYLDTLSNNSVNINGRHCMKHGNRQSTDALQQLSPAVGLRPGLGKVKVTVFRVTASSLSTPHTANCLQPPINSVPFRLYPRGALPLPPLLCRGHKLAQLLKYTQTLTNTHCDLYLVSVTLSTK